MIYALTAVILILSGLIGWMDYNNRKERKNLLNAILAKNNQELVNLELADKTEIKAPKEIETPSDYVDTNAISDEEYVKMITKDLPE